VGPAWEAGRVGGACEEAGREGGAWEAAREGGAWEAAREGGAWEAAREGGAWEVGREAGGVGCWVWELGKVVLGFVDAIACRFRWWVEERGRLEHFNLRDSLVKQKYLPLSSRREP